MDLTRLSSSVLAGVMLALAGCTSIRGFPEPPATSSASKPDPGYQLGPAGIAEYNKETDAQKKKLIRNELIDARMAELDRRFGEYERALYAEGIGVGVGTDWTILALTAAATLSTVETTKTAFSAVSTAVVGGTASFDKRALFDKALPALLAQMVAQRETIRTGIRRNEQLEVENYTWFAAESELQGFEFAGSIPGSIAGVAQDAGQKAAVARQEQMKLSSGVFSKSVSGTLLRDFWKPDGEVNPANATRLTDWMKLNGLATGPGAITVFTRTKELEELRAKAVKDLGLQ
jgi:hypothetical protein